MCAPDGFMGHWLGQGPRPFTMDVCNMIVSNDVGVSHRASTVLLFRISTAIYETKMQTEWALHMTWCRMTTAPITRAKHFSEIISSQAAPFSLFVSPIETSLQLQASVWKAV